MPRPGLPLTPGSSSDIKGKDGIQQLSSFQLSFELPPPALHDASRVSPTDSTKLSPTSTKILPPITSSPGATFPMQPAETVKARRRSSAAKERENTFALPPPPTRSRKIIQMKPRGQNQAQEEEETTGKEAGKKGAAGKKTAVDKDKDAAGEKGKKKQPSATSAAGRKIARKTAHSLIERRRRSKMNEEFAVLKGMIPACTGEMHKLSILQASIEYVRYLEDCVAKLKAQQEEDQGRTESGRQTPTARDKLPSIREFHPTFQNNDDDIEMEDSDTASPTFSAVPDRRSTHSSISPALPAQDSRNRQHSYSSVSTDQRSYSFSTTASAGTSPAFGPQVYGGYARSDASGPASTLTSPALDPQTELDQEAMAALMMLNHDRRGARGRGLSVRDLLSTCAGVDNPLFESFCLCFPSRSRELNFETLPRDLPDYAGPTLSEKPFQVTVGAPLPRVLPLKPQTYPVQPPPYYPGKSTSLEVKPLRLVRASRKRKPPKKLPLPSYFETYSKTVYQYTTTLALEAPPPPYAENMASNPIMPKVGTATLPSPPSRPLGPNSPPQSKDAILADLRRQLDDSASDLGSSVDSRGRRRRRNNKQLASTGGIKTGPVLPRLAETKPVRLQLGLNLDVELELKARLQGDVSLTLLVEKKKTSRESTELKPNFSGEVCVEELFFMRIGVISFRQKWLDREVSSSLTATVMFGIGVAGFLAGFMSSRLLDIWSSPELAMLASNTGAIETAN
ncbi:Fc.00g067490.m01.CDS01 [Cosmosporella sp. VM-42]